MGQDEISNVHNRAQDLEDSILQDVEPAGAMRRLMSSRQGTESSHSTSAMLRESLVLLGLVIPGHGQDDALRHRQLQSMTEWAGRLNSLGLHILTQDLRETIVTFMAYKSYGISINQSRFLLRDSADRARRQAKLLPVSSPARN